MIKKGLIELFSKIEDEDEVLIRSTSGMEWSITKVDISEDKETKKKKMVLVIK